MDILNAILETLSEYTQPVKATDLIAKCYQKVQKHANTYHFNILIGSGKIERSSKGFYQLKQK